MAASPKHALKADSQHSTQFQLFWQRLNLANSCHWYFPAKKPFAGLNVTAQLRGRHRLHSIVGIEIADDFNALSRWVHRIAGRPAVQRAYAIGEPIMGQQVMDEKARPFLFGTSSV